MKTFAAVAAFVGLAAAQYSALPTCAQSCANSFLTKGIGNCGTGIKCICADKSFLSDIACCLAQPGGCDESDQSSAVVFASQLCAANGVTVPSAVTCASTASGASATTPASTSATATATGATTGTATGSTTATETGTAAATTAATTAAASGASSATAAAATTSSSTSNPAPRETAGLVGGLVGGIMAIAAML